MPVILALSLFVAGVPIEIISLFIAIIGVIFTIIGVIGMENVISALAGAYEIVLNLF